MSMVALKVNTFKQLKVVEFVAFSSGGRATGANQVGAKLGNRHSAAPAGKPGG